MVNTFALSIIRLIGRVSIVLTLGCCVYVVLFLFSKNRDNLMSENNTMTSNKGTEMVSPPLSPVFNLKPFDASTDVQVRDIFSLTAPTSSGAVEKTLKGQLPDHLKIVGILIGHPSQIVIEDSGSNTTYFIDEGHSQDGIKIVSVGKDMLTVNYQGQDIIVPVKKN